MCLVVYLGEYANKLANVIIDFFEYFGMLCIGPSKTDIYAKYIVSKYDYDNPCLGRKLLNISNCTIN